MRPHAFEENAMPITSRIARLALAFLLSCVARQPLPRRSARLLRQRQRCQSVQSCHAVPGVQLRDSADPERGRGDRARLRGLRAGHDLAGGLDHRARRRLRGRLGARRHGHHGERRSGHSHVAGPHHQQPRRQHRDRLRFGVTPLSRPGDRDRVLADGGFCRRARQSRRIGQPQHSRGRAARQFGGAHGQRDLGPADRRHRRDGVRTQHGRARPARQHRRRDPGLDVHGWHDGYLRGPDDGCGRPR